MKPIIAFVASFVVATGASTGAKVMLTKPAHVASDSTKIGVDTTTTDSTAKPAAVADTTHKATAPAALPSHLSTAAESTGAPVVTPPKTKAPVSTAPKQTAAAPAVTPTTPDSVGEASERRLAKVFTAMEAKQAAKVLQHMEDADVQIILGYVGPRQAATIMAELPPERVAALSKRAMQVKTK
jgi:hypothetical protein